ncbi:MAG: hypothetical protein ABI895_34555 [Deltaproteobacteria bacterium]
MCRPICSFLLGGCLVLATACGSEHAAALPGASEPAWSVVLGTGARTFEPLADDAHATLIAGPQGAYHVWTSFLSYGFDSDVLLMQISTGWDDTPAERFDMRGEVVARLTLDAAGLPARMTQGWPAVIRDPLCDNGRALRVNLTVSDEMGNAASDTRLWILDVAEQYHPADCAAR